MLTFLQEKVEGGSRVWCKETGRVLSTCTSKPDELIRQAKRLYTHTASKYTAPKPKASARK